MRLNKRACRKLADPTWKMNLNSGLFCADPVSYTHLDVYKRQVLLWQG